jgi:c-di-GMP-binding flagellar brake protein YcgR
LVKKGESVNEMDYTSRLQAGAAGEIAINAGIYKGHYPSRVEEIRGDMIGLSHPMMKSVPLPAYREMHFTFTIEDSGALFVFDMSVRRVDTQTLDPILWANITSAPKRVQRRQFLRINCSWDVSVFHIENEAKAPMDSKWLSAKTIDISLGGYRFAIPDETAGNLIFESGDRILIRFELASQEQFQVGRATRIVHNKKTWEVGVRFDALPAITEKRLFEYIRQQERVNRET